MKTFIVGDTHSGSIEFESKPEDTLIHLGDYIQGEVKTKAKKILIIGNHDEMDTDGFDLACHGLLLNQIWFTHEPAERLPKGAKWNICGHVHYHNMNDCGYEKKWFHMVLPPNQIVELDRFIFEQQAQKRLEETWV